ncbi:hypothetical protein [Dactylosporangium sp. NPDC051541]|uniref:hypothetical protein n=1 Tax=Dactylosporangium sp. NPDC051541 TaxID=3363977 RepID=UPI0037B53788
MTTPTDQDDWFHGTNPDPVPNGRRTDPIPAQAPPRTDPTPARPATTPPPGPQPTLHLSDPMVTGAPVAPPPEAPAYPAPADTSPPTRSPMFAAEPEMRSYEPVAQQQIVVPSTAVNPWEQDDAGTNDDGLEPLAIPTNANVSQNAVQIGLWGQAESGKTTFLGALRIAAAQQGKFGRWTVSGLDDDSSEFLVAQARQMTRLHRFPEPSQTVDTLRWSFNGQLPGRFIKRPVEFVLSVQDVPGETFRHGAVMQRVVDHLARSRGIIYLFDPITLHHSNIDYFDQTLQMLSAAVNAGGRLHRGRLPHYLSVCVTKFDDPAFFRRAVRDGWVTQENIGQRLPRVPDDRAEAFFDWVCHVLRGQGASLIRDLIRANFHDSRVKYFATSSVGFRLNHQEIFDFRDFTNVQMAPDRTATIRDLVRPINVLEPLISLDRAIRG